MNTFKATFDTILGLDTNPWIYGCLVIAIYTPISWVRNIAKFSFSFMLGNFLILLAVLYVTTYCFMELSRQGGIGEGVKFVNSDYLGALGYAVYCFEGIGIVMPVMQQSASPETFKSTLIAAIATLTGIYIFFGAIGYLTWGSSPIQPYSTDMLP